MRGSGAACAAASICDYLPTPGKCSGFSGVEDKLEAKVDGSMQIGSVTLPRAVLAIILVFVAAVIAGCDVVRPSTCTVIGCTGLVIEVTGVQSQTPVTVVVTAPDGSTRSATCTSAANTCPVSFPDFTPASVTIRVSTGTHTTEETRQPAYEVTRPNGPACPPECRNARVTVAS